LGISEDPSLKNPYRTREKKFSREKCPQGHKIDFQGGVDFSRAKCRILLIPAKIFIRILRVLRPGLRRGMLSAGRRMASSEAGGLIPGKIFLLVELPD